MKEKEELEQFLELFQSMDSAIPEHTPAYMVVKACIIIIARCIRQNEGYSSLGDHIIEIIVNLLRDYVHDMPKSFE